MTMNQLLNEATYCRFRFLCFLRNWTTATTTTVQSTWTQSTIVFELGALADNWRSTTEWTNATALRTIKVVALIMTKPFSQNAAIPLLFPMIKKTHRQPSVGGFNLEFWTKWVTNLFSEINFLEAFIISYTEVLIMTKGFF